MSSYTLYGGTHTETVLGFWQRLGLLATGGVIGLSAGLCVVYAQIVGSVHPIVTQDSDNSLPVRSTMPTTDDLQPAVGVQWVQGGEDNTDWVLQ